MTACPPHPFNLDEEWGPLSMLLFGLGEIVAVLLIHYKSKVAWRSTGDRLVPPSVPKATGKKVLRNFIRDRGFSK